MTAPHDQGTPPPPGLDPAFVPEPTVEVESVSRWFGQKVAVSALSCSFGPGVTGLLGPNGAGKTTLLRILTGLISPSEGVIRVFGHNPRSVPSVYARVGFVPEEGGVHPFLSGRAYVEAAARLSGMSDAVAEADRAIREVALEDAADRPISGYSKGMRQHAKVAAALVHAPTLLILDEPLNGTDPVQRAHLIDLFRRLGSNGHTLIVSSHVLAEVDRMADRVLAMVDGKLAAAGDVQAIRRAMRDIPFRVRVTSSDPRMLAGSLFRDPSINSVTVDGDLLHVETGDLGRLGRLVPETAVEIGAHLTGFRPEDESLESVFRYLVRRR